LVQRPWTTLAVAPWVSSVEPAIVYLPGHVQPADLISRMAADRQGGLVAEEP
jgi:hypothetical protein